MAETVTKFSERRNRTAIWFRCHAFAIMTIRKLAVAPNDATESRILKSGTAPACAGGPLAGKRDAHSPAKYRSRFARTLGQARTDFQ
jgi:hypothetical protein